MVLVSTINAAHILGSFITITDKNSLLNARFCVHSSFAIILKKKRKLLALLLLYCHYKCSVALPHSAMGWSAECDCGIS